MPLLRAFAGGRALITKDQRQTLSLGISRRRKRHCVSAPMQGRCLGGTRPACIALDLRGVAGPLQWMTSAAQQSKVGIATWLEEQTEMQTSNV